MLTALIIFIILITSTILILLDDQNELAEEDEVTQLNEIQFTQASTFNTPSISQYNTADNCWIIYDNGVYDITTILDELGDVSADSCGTEVSEMSSDSVSKIAPYIVSSLIR